jgi:hypothetical protein
MPLVIEIDHKNAQSANRLIPNAELRLVRLEKATVASQSSPGTGELETEVSFKPSETGLTGTELTLAVDFEFRVLRAGEPRLELLSLACTFAADYSLRPGFSPQSDQIEAFHKGNVVLNCWPFFREFVQATAVRMNYPPPPVPLLRLQFVRPIEQTSPTSPSEQAQPSAPPTSSRRKRVR